MAEERDRGRSDPDTGVPDAEPSSRAGGLSFLARSAVHDINNLLAVITATAGLIEDRLGDGLPLAEGANPCQRIRIACGQIFAVAQQLLARSGSGCRPGTGEGPTEPIDLDAAVRETVFVAQGLMPPGIDRRFEPGGVMVLGDAAQIRRLILNLVLNAGEAMSGGGRLTIRTFVEAAGPVGGSRVTEGAGSSAPGDPKCRRPTGDIACLEVEDTGCGVSQEDQERILRPGVTSHGAGRGLGLATVARIVEEHGGTLGISSRTGRGCRVLVRLPGHAAAALSRESRAAPADGRGAVESSPVTPPPRRARTILVVEDEPVLRDVAASFLISLGYQVITAADGREALAQIRASLDGGSTVRSAPTSIDLIFLDLELPDIGGVELIEAAGAMGRAVPVLLSSGHDPSDPEIVGLRHLVAGLVKKPYTREDLAARVEAALGSGRHRRGGDLELGTAD